MTTETACYICYEKETSEFPYAINPCSCKGSIAIHLKCLQEHIRWSKVCSICHSRYRIEYLPNKHGKELITVVTKFGNTIEYTINEKGQKHGMYLIRHRNGQTMIVQSYINGIMEGPSIEYYPSGQIKMMSRFKYNRLEGEFTEWYENGLIKEESYYQDGVKHGESTIWSLHNRIGEVNVYDHGVLMEY